MVKFTINILLWSFLFILGLNETSSLPYIFKKSYEYEEIQIVLQPLLNKAFSEARGTSSQYSTDFPQQVIILH